MLIILLILSKQTRLRLQTSELKTLTDDIKTIRKIEEQITEIESQNAVSDTSGAKNDSDDTAPFQNFSGKDFDGNAVDQKFVFRECRNCHKFLVYRLQALCC